MLVRSLAFRKLFDEVRIVGLTYTFYRNGLKVLNMEVGTYSRLCMGCVALLAFM